MKVVFFFFFSDRITTKITHRVDFGAPHGQKAPNACP
jgi:hypothetical protein